MFVTKKLIVIILVILLAMFASVFLYTNLQRNTLELNFIGQANTQTIKVYSYKQDAQTQNNKPITELSAQNNKVDLRPGEYLVQSEDSREFKPYSQIINLESDTVININPSYKREYLNLLLKPQEAEIKNVIRRTINLPPGYKINNGSLLKDTNWYGTTLSVDDVSQLKINQKNADIYRVVLKKVNNLWEVVTLPPEIIISNITYKDIPKEIINLANLVPPDVNNPEELRWQNEWE